MLHGNHTYKDELVEKLALFFPKDSCCTEKLRVLRYLFLQNSISWKFNFLSGKFRMTAYKTVH
jgi:hypothetical protein